RSGRARSTRDGRRFIGAELDEAVIAFDFGPVLRSRGGHLHDTGSSSGRSSTRALEFLHRVGAPSSSYVSVAERPSGPGRFRETVPLAPTRFRGAPTGVGERSHRTIREAAGARAISRGSRSAGTLSNSTRLRAVFIQSIALGAV